MKSIYFFQIRNEITNKCLDTYNRKNGENVAVSHCHGMGGNQVSTMLLYKVFFYKIDCF